MGTTTTTTTEPTTTTTTTTTPEPTTTGSDWAGDGSDCDEIPVFWSGSNVSKLLYKTFSKAMVRMNIKQGDGITTADNTYTGFAIFARKECGNDFMNKVADGTVTFDIYDTEAEYIPQHTYLRSDGGQTSVTVQWHRSNTNGALGNAKRDQAFFVFNGLDQVNFGNKDKYACE